LKITPDPIVRTYMVGSNVWELARRMESGAGRVVIGAPHVPTAAAEGIFTMRRTNQALIGVLLLVAAILAMPLLMIATGMPSWVGMNNGMMAGYTMHWTWGLGGALGTILGGAMMLIPLGLAVASAVLLVNAFTSSTPSAR